MNTTPPNQYAQNKEVNQKLMIDMKDVPCADCRLHWHPACMTFDHLGRQGKYRSSAGRVMQPNKMLTYDPLAFKVMLEGCAVVCMNCHRIREMRRDNVLETERWQKWSAFLQRGALLEVVA